MPAKLFVGNLSFQATEEDLRELFQQSGTVESVRIVTDQFTGRPRGFGFVEMATKEEAAKAVEMLNGRLFRDRNLVVDEARPQPARTGGAAPSRIVVARAPADRARRRLAPLDGLLGRGTARDVDSRGFFLALYTHHVRSILRSMNRPGVPAPGFAKRIGPVVDERRNAEFQALESDGPHEPPQRRIDAVRLDGEPVSRLRGRLPVLLCPAHPRVPRPRRPRASSRSASTSRASDEARLLHTLRRARDADQEVAIGTATDPYQPAEGRFRVTETVLRAIARVPGLKVGITTKSTSVTRDLPLLAEIAAAARLIVNVSLISHGRGPSPAARASRPAPRSPPPRAVHAPPGRHPDAALRDAGVAVPDRRGARPAKAARGGGARRRRRGHLERALPPRRHPPVLPRLPEAGDAVAGCSATWPLYAGGAYAAAEYRQEVDRLMERLGREAGLSGLTREERVKREGGGRSRQLALFW